MFDLNRAIEADPRYAPALDARAFLKRSTGDFNGALADANTAISLVADKPDYFARRGSIRQSLKDYKGMETDFDQAVLLDPSYAAGYFGRAVARAARGNHVGAIADYGRCIEAGHRVAESTKGRDNSKRLMAITPSP